MIKGMTNGVFDMLHVGHVRFLNECKRFCDHLTVCINSDSSTARLKGSGRPIISQDDRAEMLISLESVDAVKIFDSLNVSAVMMEIEPVIWFKGAPYHIATLNEEEVRAAFEINAHIQVIPPTCYVSTTSILERIEERQSAAKNPRVV